MVPNVMLAVARALAVEFQTLNEVDFERGVSARAESID